MRVRAFIIRINNFKATSEGGDERVSKSVGIICQGEVDIPVEVLKVRKVSSVTCE